MDNQTNVSLLDKANFQQQVAGKPVDLYVLKNKHGLVSEITNFGGRVVSLWIPDAKGNMQDVVLGYDDLSGYTKKEESFFGAAVGRYGNRIGNGQFTLDSVTFELERNNGDNHLHGGSKGFHKVVWDANQIDQQTLELTYLSPDGDQGFPGNMEVKMTYQLTDENELKIEYRATTDKKTIVNLTHHSYFNLKGVGNGNILDHLMMINADQITPTNEGLIPTGELMDVKDTPFDFSSTTSIGDRIDDSHEQLVNAGGYDHNFVLRDKGDLKHAATVADPTSGRTMEVWTNEPGVQFYAGNFLDGTAIGKNNIAYQHRTGFCLETQKFPDSPNKPSFPSPVLEPGENYYSICVYKFGVN